MEKSWFYNFKQPPSFQRFGVCLEIFSIDDLVDKILNADDVVLPQACGALVSTYNKFSKFSSELCLFLQL